ncbi:unnamed protein product [Cylindrotheca closterium]|uniref:ATP-dependent transporter ycf16 n=1 Tax=Cylindrotheca closterium TaxID=2856 RepID=A0AAD2FP67_9STRA|nr:unnamed protein product [Cylindrotheca closterium]
MLSSTGDDIIETGRNDTKQVRNRSPSPLIDASIPQKLLFGWAWPLLKLGSQRPLQEVDLPNVHPEDSSHYNRKYIDTLWTRARNSDNRGLGYALLKDYYASTRFPQCILILNSAAKIGQAIALGLLMEQFTQDASSAPQTGYFWCAVMVGCGLIAFPTKQRLYFEMYRKGMQVRVGLVALIYDKSIRLASSSSSTMSAGKLTNLASNDVERFLLASIPSLYLALGPIEAIVILVVGIYTTGPVFAVGHGLFLLLVPLQVYLGRRFVRFRSEVAEITDARVTLVSQAVSGARIMKMNGWEMEFQKRIAALRAKETAKLRAASSYKALNDAIYYFSSIVVAVAIFMVQVFVLEEPLTPRKVYTTLTLSNILHLTLTKQIPNAVMTLSECYVSCKRIQEFLELPENDPGERQAVPDGSGGTILSLKNASFDWEVPAANGNALADSKSSTVALHSITLSFDAGNLYCIMGKVGCGKSALIQALAGELYLQSGSIERNFSSLAYTAQDPWIMNGSIRDNIVMGKKWDKDWYQKVVDACGLRQDLQEFQNGDTTIVGDRGIQISGGQRARIGLARAFYRDAQVLLLDDPLSAIDSTLSRLIYQNAIQELGTKQGKCIIMATHEKQHVGPNDDCIMLDGGSVTWNGPLDSEHSRLADEFRSSKPENEVIALETNEMPVGKQAEEQKETRGTGIVKWKTWSAYGKALGGTSTLLFFFLFFAITQSTLLVLIVEVGSWAEASSDSQNTGYWLSVILGMTAAVIFLSITRAQMTFHLLIGASKRLHDQMLNSVLRSKIVFFDTNPLGRVLNRFSADVGISDETLPLTIYDFSVGFFMVIGGVVTASVVLPFILVALPPLLFYFITLRSTFVKTTRELKRIEGIARSPIFAMIGESLHGMSTIRANGCSEYFKSNFEAAHDAHTRAFFSFVAASRWFATRMDILSFTLMATASILAVLFHEQGWFDVNPAVLGLALTILLQIATTNFPWIVRQSAEIVNQMVAVERVLEFGSLPPEAPLNKDDDKKLATAWPDNGSIQAHDLSIRYRESLPLALNKLSFSIPSGARVGVVGRTGSGKSTLVQTLFRLLEAENGSITIDGVDISTVGLHRLRKSISVIPQMPTLFGGCTVRENLDLFGVYSDEAIAQALDRVHMTEAMAKLPDGVSSMVSEGGSNFSVGERQLLCLARAILKQNKILVLDEATASVDKDTDELLHQTLNEAYTEATIIKIAHRLDTVIEDDHVLVLGSGQLQESGSPAELLETNGTFHTMVEATGETLARELRRRAHSSETRSC